jgi:hypothetical protein
MLRKYYLLMFFSMVFVSVFTAAVPVVKPKNSEKQTHTNLNEANLSEMLKKYQKDLFISGQVKQEKWIKDLEITLKSTGVFEIAQLEKTGLLVDWQILKPEPLHICIEDQKIYIKDNQQKNPIEQDLGQMNSQGQGSMVTLKALMASDTTLLFKEFPSVTKTFETLTLKNDKLTVDIKMDESKYIKEIRFAESNGDVLKIEFFNIKKNKKSQLTKKCSARL